ncbi:HK97 family phage prohead protease [Brevundimonas sp.]|uniref:HK97 family phage prohead protease n=1 Tax=Brevundimonas sp. TaxID=1871086 RepID=UPI0035B0AA3F
MSKTTRTFEIEDYVVRDAQEGERAPRMEGYAIVFNSDSSLIREGGRTFIERVAPGFCRGSLEGVAEGRHIHALWSHDRQKPLGSTRNDNLVLREDEKGIWFSLSTERFERRELAAARDGDLQVSFGMRKIDYDWSVRDDGVKVGLIRSAEVFEISPVVFAAYNATSAELREEMIRSHDEWEASQRVEEVVEEQVEDKIDVSRELVLIELGRARIQAR